MSLTADEVRWVAHLARLQLTDAELATMTRQLSAIVEYVDLLKQVNTDGVEPLAHALEVHNVFRDDEPATVAARRRSAGQRAGRDDAAASSTRFPPCWNNPHDSP